MKPLDLDYIELYQYDGSHVTLTQVIDVQSSAAGIRNGSPIADINGRAILWHNGYYNPKSYKDFRTDAKLYRIEE